MWHLALFGDAGSNRAVFMCGCCQCSTCAYVRRNKTDRADTDALLEAARCGEIRPVPVKTVEQQALQAIHRIRTQWQTARVARINAMRGLLAEHGHAIPVGARTVLRRVTAILSDPDAAIPDVLRQSMALVVDEVHGLEGEDRRTRGIACLHAHGEDILVSAGREGRIVGVRVPPAPVTSKSDLIAQAFAIESHDQIHAIAALSNGRVAVGTELGFLLFDIGA